MALHPPFHMRLQKRLYRRRYLGLVMLFAAALTAVICVADPPNLHDRTAVIVLCGAMAGLGALSYLRGRELPTTDIMRFAESRGGLVTLSEIATTLDLDPETVVKTLRKLQKLGVAIHRWEEVRRNVWEFPDYMQLPPVEPHAPVQAEMVRPVARDMMRETLTPMSVAHSAPSGKAEAPLASGSTLLAAAQ